MPIAIEQLREEVEKQFIGFSPSTNSVKPAHIANGLFRVILGSTSYTKLLNNFVFTQTQKGEIPWGHELSTIYSILRDNRKIDSQEIKEMDLNRLRVLLKKVVAADNAVYLHKDNMESYSAGFKGFISQDRVGQGGGELIGEWLRRYSPSLAGCLDVNLHQPDDNITLLCSPLLDQSSQPYSPEFDYDRVYFLNKELPSAPEALWNGLAESATTLSSHLQAHPNKLVRLRLAVLFASFVLIRHLATLEDAYVPQSRGSVPPFLLDFSTKGNETITRASKMTYTLSCQAIARFYAWALGKELRKSFTFAELVREAPPQYKRRTTTAMKEIWQLALTEAGQNKHPFTICGQALYDMMALEAEGNPIGYLRQLGYLSGLMWPPVNLQPTKQFALQQDMLETLVRGAINPGEVIDMSTLQERFWSRYGLIIGGRLEDEQKLIDAGIYQADSDSLEENLSCFANSLSQLGFANLLADGVLQVDMGEADVS